MGTAPSWWDCPERTTAQGISKLAQLLLDPAQQVTQVIVVELPKQRAFMHLDTAMTMVDRDAFSVYPTSIGTFGLGHWRSGMTAAPTD